MLIFGGEKIHVQHGWSCIQCIWNHSITHATLISSNANDSQDCQKTTRKYQTIVKPQTQKDMYTIILQWQFEHPNSIVMYLDCIIEWQRLNHDCSIYHMHIHCITLHDSVCMLLLILLIFFTPKIKSYLTNQWCHNGMTMQLCLQSGIKGSL